MMLIGRLVIVSILVIGLLWPRKDKTWTHRRLLILVFFFGALMRLTLPNLEPGESSHTVQAFGQSLLDIPFGFHTDEGHNALDAWRIANEGWRPAYLPGNNGREPLYMYLIAACLKVFGPTIRAARFAGFIAGMLALAAQYYLVRALPFKDSRKIALYSSAFLALTFWPIAQARYALRANLLPFWVALLLLFWWRSLKSKAPRHAFLNAALAGLSIAAAVHTHITGRFLAIILIGSAVWELIFTSSIGEDATLSRSDSPNQDSTGDLPSIQPRRLQILASLVIALGIALAGSWPQIAYFQSHPEMVGYRAEQVSILNPEVNEGDLLGTFSENAWNIVQMPVLRGDTSWYHNIKRRPVWNGVFDRVAFLIGLWVLILMLFGRRGRNQQSLAVLLLLTAGITSAPSLFSMGAPNYVRLTGLWPVLFLVPALGLDSGVRWVQAKAHVRESDPEAASEDHADRNGQFDNARSEKWWADPRQLATLTIVLLGLVTAYDYFGRYAPRSEVYTAFNAAAVERGQALAWISDTGPTYVTPALWKQSVIRFTNLHHDPEYERFPRVFDPRHGLVLPASTRDMLLHRGILDPSRNDLVVFEEWANGNYVFDPVEADAAEAFSEKYPTATQGVQSSFPITRHSPESNGYSFRLHAGDMSILKSSVSAIRPVDFGDHLRLVRAKIVEPVDELEARSSESLDHANAGQSIQVILIWKALQPTELDHNFFLQLVSESDGQGLAQFDGPPLGESYPTNRWYPGEHVMQSITLDIAADVPSGPAVLRHGWYNWRDGQRLEISDNPENAAEIGRLEIR